MSFEIFGTPIFILSLDVKDNIGAPRKCIALLFLLRVLPEVPPQFFLFYFLDHQHGPIQFLFLEYRTFCI